ncbi:MAG: glycosyltransferase family 2 protein [Phycisphaerales bacterium]|nr:glycosyltransferase family 2 protein [Phycisphaerales bacterium]
MIVGGLIVGLFLPLAVVWGIWLVFAVVAALPRTGGMQACRLNKDGCLIDILIPAHDEELLLPGLLSSLQAQSDGGKERMGTILVVADHCGDATAMVARSLGAMVLERSTGPRGKPAALRDGLDFLKAQTRNALLVLDADCICSANYLEKMASGLDAGHLVLQSASVLVPEDGKQKAVSPSLLAFALKDFVRPRGMARLGIPVQLFGTGMCFHPDVIRNGALYFHDHLAEDLALSHELLLRDIPAAFVCSAMIRSPLPTDAAARSMQKLRWETGQLQTWRRIPGLLARLVFLRRWRSVIALLDWSAPPLALAVFAWGILTVVVFLLMVWGMVSPWVGLVPFVTIAILAIYVFVGAMQLVTIGDIGRLVLEVPRFLGWKAALYGRMLLGRFPVRWQRTPRAAGKPVG